MTDRVDDFLTRLRVDDVRIAAARTQYEQCDKETTLKGTTYDREKVQTSPEDPMVMLYARREKAYDDLMQAIEQRRRDVDDVKRACSHLTAIHREILIAYYTMDTSVHDIASALHYTESNVYKQKRIAEDALDKVLREGY